MTRTIQPIYEFSDVSDMDEDALTAYADPNCDYCCGHGYRVDSGSMVPYGDTWACTPESLEVCDCVSLAHANAVEEYEEFENIDDDLPRTDRALYLLAKYDI